MTEVEQDFFTPVNHFPEKLTYASLREVGVIPNSRRFWKIQSGQVPGLQTPTIEWQATVGPNEVIVGSKSYIKTAVKVKKANFTNVLAGDNIRLAEGADTILFNNVQLYLNQSQVYQEGNYAAVLRSEFDRIVETSDTERKGNETSDRRLGADGVLDSTYVSFNGSEEWYKNVILDGATFYMYYPLNHIAFMGPDDKYLPPGTAIRLVTGVTSALGSLFTCDDDIVDSPLFEIQSSDLYLCTESITNDASTLLLTLLNKPEGIPFDTLEMQLLPLPYQIPTSTGLNFQNQPMTFTPDMLSILSYPDSSFRSQSPWNSKSYLRRDMQFISTTQLMNSGTILRRYENMELDRNQFLRELKAYIHTRPYDVTTFGFNKGTSAVYTSLTDGKKDPHQKITAFSLSGDIRFSSPITDGYSFFLVTWTKRAFTMTSAGVSIRL